MKEHRNPDISTRDSFVEKLRPQILVVGVEAVLAEYIVHESAGKPLTVPHGKVVELKGLHLPIAYSVS